MSADGSPEAWRPCGAAWGLSGAAGGVALGGPVECLGFVPFSALRTGPRRRSRPADRAASFARRAGVFPLLFVQFLTPAGPLVYPPPDRFPAVDAMAPLAVVRCPRGRLCLKLLQGLAAVARVPPPLGLEEALRALAGEL